MLYIYLVKHSRVWGWLLEKYRERTKCKMSHLGKLVWCQM